MKKPNTPINVHQLKITLVDSNPPIWRRIQITEDSTFWDLHVAIQCAMGWDDSHMHNFIIINKKDKNRLFIGTADDDDILEWEQPIKEHLALCNKNTKIIYTYDFGDNWDHDLVLEKILPAEQNTKYPKCIDGERACPPGDCGGIFGYEEFLKIINNPKHPEYEERLEWLGEGFDSEKFDCSKIKFRNAKRALEDLL